MNTLPSYLTIATFGTSASKIQPDPTTYSGGYLAGQRFPAQHENYFMNGLTGNGNTLITQVNSIQNELNNWLAYFSVTPSGADTQIRDLFNTRMALKLDASSYTAADVLAKLLTVDADNAGINATTLKSLTIGQTGTSYIPYVDATQNFVVNSTGFLSVGSAGVYNATETVIAGRRAQAGKSVIEIDNQNSGASAYCGFRLDSFGSAWDILTGSTTANSNALDFTNGSVRMRITSGGNVLIGTTNNFAGRLQIAAPTTDMLLLTNADFNNSSIGTGIKVLSAATTGNVVLNIQNTWNGGAIGGDLAINGISGRVYVNRLNDDGSGAALQVNGGISGGFAKLTDSTASTNSTTGALVVTGGAGVGGAMNVAGVTKITNNTASTSSVNGALVVTGGVGIMDALNVSGLGRFGGNCKSVGIATTTSTTTSTTFTTAFSLTTDPVSLIVVQVLNASGLQSGVYIHYFSNTADVFTLMSGTNLNAYVQLSGPNIQIKADSGYSTKISRTIMVGSSFVS